MEIELQGIPQSLRPQYQTRLRTAKADLTRYKKTSKDLHTQYSRADLLTSPGRAGTPTSDEPYSATSDRTRLLTGMATLEDGTRRLQESQRIALETEDQGAEILVNLRSQREQIENARDTVGHSFAESGRTIHCLPATDCRHGYRPRVWDAEENDQAVTSVSSARLVRLPF